jgi:nucleoside-diphosphate-sugar epimerase
MKILITGGAGFLGARLARTLLARGKLAGRSIAQLVLADAAALADLCADARVQAHRPTAGRLRSVRGGL